MLYPIQEELVKIQPKGLLTIPKRMREELGFVEGDFARVREEKGRLIIEPVRTLPYQVRSYSHSDLREFFAEDERETKLLIPFFGPPPLFSLSFSNFYHRSAFFIDL